jgi:hypothetical protein
MIGDARTMKASTISQLAPLLSLTLVFARISHPPAESCVKTGGCHAHRSTNRAVPVLALMAARE